MSYFKQTFNRKTLFCLILALFSFQGALFAKHYKYQVAACAIFQNEAPYLKEWIEFHRVAGVDHFYLYNNLSSDDFLNVLAPYVKSGVVELIDWPYAQDSLHNWNFIQCEAYNHAVKRSRKKAKWLAVLDIDEFLFPVKVFKLSQFLNQFKHFAGVVVNWQMYGTSRVPKILPGSLLIEELTFKAPTTYSENIHVKSIVRPKFVRRFDNPHFCSYKSGHFAVNSNKEFVDGPFSPSVLVDKIRINHYWTRDVDFLMRVKLPRRQNWQDSQVMMRMDLFNSEQDTSIIKYVSKLKRRL